MLTIISSVLFAMAQPNEFLHYGSISIALIALVPLLYVIYTSSSLKDSIVTGAVFGIVSTSLIYFWLLFFQDFSIWTLGGVVITHTLYFIILSPAIFFIGKNRSLRPFLTAAVWVGYEYLKSVGYMGFPWGLMAQTAGIFPIVQIADITGQWGISFLIVLVNAMILESLINRNKSTIFNWSFTVIIISGTLLYGLYSNKKEIPWEKTLKVVLVQQDADSWITGQEIESIRKGQELTRKELAKTNGKPDLIVWSENAFRYPYTENSNRYQITPRGDPFSSFLKETDIPLLVGSPYILDRKTMSALNAVLLISPAGEILKYYGKNHLVPFAENIPFWNIGFVQSLFKNVIGLNSPGWTIGAPNIIFQVPLSDGSSVKFGTPICFEDSFPYIARNMIKSGADMFINLSNDSWSKTISGETQHLAAARLRAIENRRVLIRSTNAGVTTVIDPWGRMNYTLPLFQSQTVTADVPVYMNKYLTVYTVLGDWFPLLLIIGLVAHRIYCIYIQKNRDGLVPSLSMTRPPLH